MKDPSACLNKLPELLHVYQKGMREAEAKKAANAVPSHTPTPPSGNSSVDHCCRAYELAWETAKERGAGRNAVKAEAEQAFRRAMPTLAGKENIRDFVACVAHGVLIEAISGPDAARLLYAAQIAVPANKAFQDAFRIPPGFFLQPIDSPTAPPMSPQLRTYLSGATPRTDPNPTT